MNQSTVEQIAQATEVKLKKIGTDKCKRVPTVTTYAQLLEQAKAMAKVADVTITYKDSDEDYVEVTDDQDLSMALASSMSTQNKITFFI